MIRLTPNEQKIFDFFLQYKAYGADSIVFKKSQVATFLGIKESNLSKTITRMVKKEILTESGRPRSHKRNYKINNEFYEDYKAFMEE